MVIRLQKNSEFGRNNANRSPNKQPKRFPINGQFPRYYGLGSPRFGKLSYKDLVKRIHG